MAAGDANFLYSADKFLKELRDLLSEYGSAQLQTVSILSAHRLLSGAKQTFELNSQLSKSEWPLLRTKRSFNYSEKCSIEGQLSATSGHRTTCRGIERPTPSHF